jgi:MerR family transcriptional regulator, copper efflux regulator
LLALADPSRLNTTPKPITTKLLCQRAGVTRGMLRVYEREGLLAPARRSAVGYRNYDDDAPARLQAIRQLKEIGFTLREIALLLSEHDDSGFTPQQIAELANDQLREIDARLARLQLVRSYVAAVAAGDTAVFDDPECAFLMQFLAAGNRDR